jgi:hypothetical protein
MSFYVTLPSDSSLRYFPDNKISHFTTQLPTPIVLNGEWEVGLSEIIYPHSWNNVNENNHLFRYEIGNGKLNTRVIPPGCYDAPDIVKAVSKKLPENQFFLSYNEITKRVKIQILKGAYLHLEGLSPLLGFPSVKLTGVVRSTFVADTHSDFSFFYVYSDIVEPQVVGDIQAPLLRIVKVDGKNGEIISCHYDRPQYVPVIRQSFQTLDIELRLNSGDFVPFERGKVIVVLHFRMRQIL